MLYKILPDAPRSNYDPRQKTRPQADGIVGSTNVKSADLVTSQLKDLSLNQYVGGKASSVSSTPTKSTDVHSVQSSTNPNGNQQPGGKKIKDVVTIVRVGGIIIINPRTMIIMRSRIIMLVRERKKGER
jgi:hypothetical protein